jgi:multidrug resistance efflux pump
MDNHSFELRSDEVQEILGTPPSWLVRWGTLIIFMVFLTLLFVSYLLPFHETASSSLRVTTTEPPKRLISENGGYISEILVSNEDTVSKGDPIMVFKSKARYQDVLIIEDLINAIASNEETEIFGLQLPTDLLLGEFQDDYYDFLRKQETFGYLFEGTVEKLNVFQLEKKIQTIQSSLQLELRRKAKLAEQLDLAYTRQNMEERNVENRILDPDVLRQTKEDILSLEREMQTIEVNIKNKQFEIEIVRDQITGVKTSSTENLFASSSQLKDAFVKLRNSIKDWKKSFMIVAPIDGIVLYANENIGEQQFVAKETELMVVVSLNQSETIGRMMIDVGKSAKIEIGQKVIIRLNGYPQREFGVIQGVVVWKGLVPNNGLIPLEINFPKGLITSIGKEIEPKQEMIGQGDIIISEKRFIQRIFEVLKNLTA